MGAITRPASGGSASTTDKRLVARGQRVGRYELVQLLGEGGMGTVWLAHPHDAPDQLFAIKTVSEQYAADPRVCSMFVKEARLAAAIDHPNVVHLYDVGLHGDVPFYVMEWIDGFSLRNVAHAVAQSGERVPAGIALRIASDLCAGLHAAHELKDGDGNPLGLVHRDVSPHNVLVTREGIAKLIDFGVAKARDLATGSDQSVVGGLKGKVRFMAPEQALDQPIDRRADLFSVGAITYLLLTGRAPFEGPNELATINALLATTPVFVPDDLPEPVKWILRRVLARRPENRFADAQEMQDAIELALIELGLRDKHSDVAESLATFDQREEDDAFTSMRAAPLPQLEDAEGPEPETATKPLVSVMPAGVGPAAPTESSPVDPHARTHLHLEKPPTTAAPPIVTSAASIPARQSSLADTGVHPAKREPGLTGAWRFGAAAAGFLAVIGLGAAVLVRDAPASAPSRTVTEIDSAPIPSESVPPDPSASSQNTPIIDIGDLDDGKRGTTGKPRPKTSRPPTRPTPSGAKTSTPKR